MERIEFHHLSKSYGSVTAVQDESLTLNPGPVTPGGHRRRAGGPSAQGTVSMLSCSLGGPLVLLSRAWVRCPVVGWSGRAAGAARPGGPGAR